MTHFDILVCGPIFCDLIFTGLESTPILGQEIFSKGLTLTVGGSAIVASGLHRLGVKVGLVANLGNDPISKLTWDILGDLGLDRSLIHRFDQPLTQLTVALSYPEDRAFVTYIDLDENRPDIGSLLENTSAQHVHFGSFLAIMDQPGLIQKAHTSGLSTSLDPGWDQSTLVDLKFKQALGGLDIFFPNQLEFSQIADQQQLNLAAKYILDYMEGGLIAVKQGAEGAIAFTADRPKGTHSPAISVNAVDTTGAGDSFDAGFLYAYLNHQTLEDCLKIGVICGSLSTTRIGGIAGFPTIEEVQKWL
jgi:sugar/nucleoside kinase (ribokinase family)